MSLRSVLYGTIELHQLDGKSKARAIERRRDRCENRNSNSEFDTPHANRSRLVESVKRG